jgi:hypothetical protein
MKREELYTTEGYAPHCEDCGRDLSLCTTRREAIKEAQRHIRYHQSKEESACVMISKYIAIWGYVGLD